MLLKRIMDSFAEIFIIISKCSTLNWPMRFKAGVGKYRLPITRLLNMSKEKKKIHRLLHNGVVILSACALVGR